MKAYLPEINGLRAFAVLSVVLFHAYPDFFPGGFIGVDIFFVVSGFVITRTYLNSLLSREISLRQFFLRRVRRLAPAYILLLLLVTPVAYTLLDPVRLDRYGASLLSQPLYLQNMVFWHQGEYFHAAWTKPLLHTWSLAVEEQFYLGFALLVILVRRLPKSLWPALCGLIFVSVFSAYAMTFISPRTGFYWMPFRAWEFAAGILACLVSSEKSRCDGSWNIRMLFLGASAALFASALAFDEKSTFPGPQSLIAVSATVVALLIMELRPVPEFRLLRLPAVQYMGNLSYSFYLWHWPLISLATIALGKAYNAGYASLLVAASFLLAMASYHWVETPIRKGLVIRGHQKLLASFAVSSVVVLTAGIFLAGTQGALFQYPEPLRTLYTAALQASNERCARTWRVIHPKSEFCPINAAAHARKPGVLILGDSHAAQWHEALGEFGERNGLGVYLAARTCDFDEYGSNRVCSDEVYKRLIKQAESSKVKKILLISKWPDQGPNQQRFQVNLEQILSRGIDVVISEVVPHGRQFDPYRKAKWIEGGVTDFLPYPASDHLEKVAKQRGYFETLEARYSPQVRLLKPADSLCTSDSCAFYTDGQPNYVDDNHISRKGVERLLPLYAQALAISASLKSARPEQ